MSLWNQQLSLLITEPWADFALLDSGAGRKLERYGPYRFIRPEPQALWSPAQSEWTADGEFIGGSDEEGGGRWNLADHVPPRWTMAHGAVRFHATNTPFRHLGFFPDMAAQWDFMRPRVTPQAGARRSFLNVFGYTGVASLIAAEAGAQVTHVDASKKAVAAARENAGLSGLSDAPVRWLIDDALKFLRREVRRGNRYHGLMLDPPKYGRGPDGEVWSLERDLPELVDLARQLVTPDGFVILTVYAIRMSAIALGELMADAFASLGGSVEAGDMALREERLEEGREEGRGGRLLPTAIFARWSA